MAKNKESNAEKIGGVAFIGSIITGTGIGLLVENVAVGSVIGVGVGFLVMAVIWAVVKN